MSSNVRVINLLISFCICFCVSSGHWNKSQMIQYTRNDLLAKISNSTTTRLHQGVIRTVKNLGLNAKSTRRGKRGGVKLNQQLKQLGVNQNNLIHIECDPISPPISLTKVCLGNAQSARNKVDTLTGYILEEDLDITVLTETWLKDGDIAMTRDLAPDGFSIYNVNRKLKSGGGVAIIYRDGLIFKPTNHKHFESLEYILGSVSNSTTQVTLLVVYRPPGSNSCPQE